VDLSAIAEAPRAGAPPLRASGGEDRAGHTS
jgi:hypothetical protein